MLNLLIFHSSFVKKFNIFLIFITEMNNKKYFLNHNKGGKIIEV